MWLRRYLKSQVQRSLAKLCHAVLREDLQMLPFPVLTTRCSSIPGGPCFWPVSLCFSFSSGRFSSRSCSASSNSSSPWLLGSSAGFTSSMAAFCNFQKRMLNMHFYQTLFHLKATPARAALEPTPYPVKPAGTSPRPSGPPDQTWARAEVAVPESKSTLAPNTELRPGDLSAETHTAAQDLFHSGCWTPSVYRLSDNCQCLIRPGEKR